jgi:hypothetical protein
MNQHIIRETKPICLYVIYTGYWALCNERKISKHHLVALELKI